MFFVPFRAGAAHVVPLRMVWANDDAPQSMRQLRRDGAHLLCMSCDGCKWMGKEKKHRTIH
jgi:hypothetical protein